MNSNEQGWESAAGVSQLCNRLAARMGQVKDTAVTGSNGCMRGVHPAESWNTPPHKTKSITLRGSSEPGGPGEKPAAHVALTQAVKFSCKGANPRTPSSPAIGVHSRAH